MAIAPISSTGTSAITPAPAPPAPQQQSPTQKVSETSYTAVDGSVITTITYADGTTETTTEPGDTVSFSFSPTAGLA